METIKNNKKLNSFMGLKKIFMLFMILGCLGSVFSIDLVFDQTKNIQDYDFTNKGNTLEFNQLGNINRAIAISETEFRDFDYNFEFSKLNNDLFFLLQNGRINQSVILMWRGDLTEDPTLYSQEFTLQEQGIYYFKFEHEGTNDIGEIYLNYVNDTYLGTVSIVEEMPKGLFNIWDTFTSPFIAVMGYVVELWKIGYYTIVFLMTLGFIGSMFGIAFYLYQMGRKMRNKKLKGNSEE